MNQIMLYVVSLLAFIAFGCNQTAKEQVVSLRTESEMANLEMVYPRLYKSCQSGAYYFQFLHEVPGREPESRFVVVENIHGDTIKHIDERALKRVFGVYTDGRYLFRLSNKYMLYEVYTNPIDSLADGCYFENSNYRIRNGRLQYYVGHGVRECWDSESEEVIEYPLADSKDVQVIELSGRDCAIVNGNVLVDGCWLDGLIYIDNSFRDKVDEAVRKHESKPKICF